MPTMLETHKDTNHLFNSSKAPTQYHTISFWKKPLQASEVIQELESRLTSLTIKRGLFQDSLGGGGKTTNKIKQQYANYKKSTLKINNIRNCLR